MPSAAAGAGPRHPTKGRTAAGRLRLLDAFLRLRPPPSFASPPRPGTRPVVVDLGFGETPITSRELVDVLSGLPHAPRRVIAVEQAPHRVVAARAALPGSPALEFREGGFELPLRSDEDVRWVRVMNVLRSYPLAAAQEAHAMLAQRLPEGARIWEGSADPHGHLLTCHLLRVEEGTLVREGLLFATDFARGFAPLQFRDWLARDLRRSVRPGHPLHAFFGDWTAAFEAARGAGIRASPARFEEAARRLGAMTPGIDPDPTLLGAGLMRWAPPEGVPR